jgi:hypothetical protein
VSDFGPVNFSPAALEALMPPISSDDVAASKGIKKASPGDAQLGGAVINVDPTLTMADQELADMVKFRGSPPPLADQIGQGLDEEQMAALQEQCNNGQLSVNDLAAELTIIMLKNALENKTIERQMRAELAQVQFQNGMKIADLIKTKGELAYKKAVTQAVTQLASCIGSLVTSKLVEKALTPKKGSQGDADAEHLLMDSLKTGPTAMQREAARRTGEMVGNLVGKVVETAGTLIAAEFDLGISKIDAQIKAKETMGQLVDSISRSVQSSISAQEQAIQFAMSMMEKIFSLAHQSASSIINNSRV